MLESLHQNFAGPPEKPDFFEDLSDKVLSATADQCDCEVCKTEHEERRNQTKSQTLSKMRSSWWDEEDEEDYEGCNNQDDIQYFDVTVESTKADEDKLNQLRYDLKVKIQDMTVLETSKLHTLQRLNREMLRKKGPALSTPERVEEKIFSLAMQAREHLMEQLEQCMNHPNRGNDLRQTSSASRHSTAFDIRQTMNDNRKSGVLDHPRTRALSSTSSVGGHSDASSGPKLLSEQMVRNRIHQIDQWIALESEFHFLQFNTNEDCWKWLGCDDQRTVQWIGKKKVALRQVASTAVVSGGSPLKPEVELSRTVSDLVTEGSFWDMLRQEPRTHNGIENGLVSRHDEDCLSLPSDRRPRYMELTEKEKAKLRQVYLVYLWRIVLEQIVDEDSKMEPAVNMDSKDMKRLHATWYHLATVTDLDNRRLDATQAWDGSWEGGEEVLQQKLALSKLRLLEGKASNGGELTKAQVWEIHELRIQELRAKQERHTNALTRTEKMLLSQLSLGMYLRHNYSDEIFQRQAKFDHDSFGIEVDDTKRWLRELLAERQKKREDKAMVHFLGPN